MQHHPSERLDFHCPKSTLNSVLSAEPAGERRQHKGQLECRWHEHVANLHLPVTIPVVLIGLNVARVLLRHKRQKRR